ncbi:MAG: aminopeptidase P family protein [Bifidobacteriaceae bacterium]|jgi:Xaa-Pro aminopeptidase|nr:aminopeptidase P family protein [Bifidobacteriaceae bacterium]MCI1914198.1 aminopeptidase P family protein [Bifidobacteriaceae bacterium]
MAEASAPQVPTRHAEVKNQDIQGSDDITERVNNRSLRPDSPAFREFMKQGWAEESSDTQPMESSKFTPARIEALGAKFPGERLVIPAGVAKVRNNDCDYPYRPDTTFAYYTGLGQDFEAGAVLVLEPNDSADSGATHTPVLYLHPRADHTTRDYYRSAAYGEYWVGPRPGLDEFATMTGFETRDISLLPDALSKDVGSGKGGLRVRVVKEADPEITQMVETVREQNGFDDPASNNTDDDLLHEVAATARMIKDSYEVGEMRKAIAATHDGFDSILSALPSAVDNEHGERVLEGAFNSIARQEGNDVGYGTIVASGPHAPTLHWMRNTGVVRQKDMLLIDAGVEVNSLYTADITRTFPVSGHFSALQRRLYEAVYRAQQAGFAAAQPGRTYSDIHHACMRSLAESLHEWGILPVPVEESLKPEGQQHRRWHACGVAHHLGIDVHDCAEARYESYQDAKLTPGMLFTIEPGLYFRENDLLIPPEYRGIGIRIEDDVLMTENGPEWLSKPLIPSAPDEVEQWMADRAASAAAK